MNDKSKRNSDLDILKGIGIVLVILGHQNLPIGHFIYSFHMPLFFLISGYLYYKKEIKESLVKDFRRLIIPYFIGCVFVVSQDVFFAFLKHDLSYIKKSILSIIWGCGYISDKVILGNMPSIGAIWFLLALFWCKNMYNIIEIKIVSTRQKLTIVLLIAVMAILIEKYFIKLPFSLLPGLSALPFFMLGTLCKNKHVSYSVMFIIIICWCISYIYSYVYVVSCDYGLYPIDILGSCGGAFCFYKIAKFISKIPFLKTIFIWLGMNTLSILCFHAIPINHALWVNLGINNLFIIVIIKLCIPIAMTIAGYFLPFIRERLYINQISCLKG